MNWLSVLFLFGALLVTDATSKQANLEQSFTTGNNTRSSESNIHIAQVTVTNVGRIQYQDGEVSLFRNQMKPSDFFFTPFPHVEPNLTECIDNEFSGHIELKLVVSLYTTNLRESVERHITMLDATCQSQQCSISLLPMHSIRLIQKGIQTSESKRKYTLNSEWQSNTLLLQTIPFIIYTPNISLCESLKTSIISRCSLSNFEIQYSLKGQQTVARILDVSTEHVKKTSMYNQIKSQLPENSRDIVALRVDDYKKLSNQTMDQLTMSLRVEEGFESIQDPTEIDRLLDRELQYNQAPLTKIDDPLWESLYWTPELTRPDLLSKVLKKIMKQDGTDSDMFRYDYWQADKVMKQNLTLHDRQNLDNFAKHLVAQAEDSTNPNGAKTHASYKPISSSLDMVSGTEEIDRDVDDLIHYKMDMSRFNGTMNEKRNGIPIMLERRDAEKLVRYFSEHVEIQGDIIKPKPMRVILVKISLLRSNAKLFTHVIHVKTRTDVHALPVRCSYEYRNHSLLNDWLAEKYDRLSTIVNNKTNTIDGKYDRLLNNVNNLTNIGKKTDQSTKALINRIMAEIFSMQTGISCSNECPTVLERDTYLLIDDKTQTPRVSFTQNGLCIGWDIT